jgi:prefoldin subunit 5
VAKFMAQPGATTQTVIQTLQEVRNELSKIEGKLQRLREGLKEAIPEITENLEVIEFAKSKQKGPPVRTNFQVSASIFAEADLEQAAGKVVLWVGASTAVEVTYAEAEKMLKSNLDKKNESLERTTNDIKVAKAMITTADVSIARIYNHDVKMRRAGSKADEE